MNEQGKVFCRYCGKQIDTDAIFCNHCGKSQIIGTNPHSASERRSFRDFIKTHKKGLKRILWGVLSILIIGVLVVICLASYEYYYKDYLPEKYNQDAYKDIVDNYNDSNGETKLDLAIKICTPFYDWQKDYPKAEKGRIAVLLRFEDKSERDGYCSRACNYIASEAKNGNSKAQYAYGIILLGGENSYWLPDTTRAIYWFNEAAKNNYPPAYGNMGITYEYGVHVDKNLKKAIEYYKKGVALNDAKSQYRLGSMYRDGVSVENGWHWELDSTTNYMSGDNVIREYYDSDRGRFVYVFRKQVTNYEILLPQDINQAKLLWKKAADQGCREAEECLQQVYD